MSYELLKGKRSTIEIRCWEPWFREVGRMRRAFREAFDFDPMCNETASMGVMAAAASRARLLAMTDYVCRKRGVADGRKFRNGRADLWVGQPGLRSWAFEAKQFSCAPGTRQTTLEGHLSRACHDAVHVPGSEADLKFGLLIATAREIGQADRLETIARAQAEMCFAACRFDGGELPVYAFIRRAHRLRRTKGQT